MKYSYQDMPETMKGTYGEYSRAFGFSWPRPSRSR